MAIRTIIDYSNSFEGKMAANIKTRWAVKEARSAHTPQSSIKNEAVSAALWLIIRGMCGMGKYLEVNLATFRDCGYAEIRDVTGMVFIACCTIQNDGRLKFSAAEATATGALSKYGDARDGGVLTAAFLALRLSHDDDHEIADQINALIKYAGLESNAAEWDDAARCDSFSKSLCILSQNLYYAAKDVYHDVSIRQVYQLRQNDLKILSKKNLEVVSGKPIFLKAVSSSALKGKPTKGSYAFGAPVGPDVDALIPDLPDSYVCPKWVLNICQDIKESSDFAEPIRNILLSGPAGTGKTTGAQAIAYFTGRPYVKVTCSPDTDMFDMVGQMLPNVERQNIHKAWDTLGIPTIDDIENDPQGAFVRLFGHEMGPLDAAEDCYREIFERMTDYFGQACDYTYVESNFIRAIENGWVVELQEPNVIKRNSVLVGLNGIMENDAGMASITLPTGKTIKRHRDAIVIISTNGGYDGVSPLQQSVLSRIQSSYLIEQPDLEETAKRIVKNTGFPDPVSLSTMCKTMFAMQKYCKEKDITDGVCGPRELQNWAKKAMLLQKRTAEGLSGTVSQESVIKAAFPTFLYKVSQDEDSIEEVITAVFSKLFDQAMVNEAKQLYNEGDL